VVEELSGNIVVAMKNMIAVAQQMRHKARQSFSSGMQIQVHDTLPLARLLHEMRIR